MESHEQIRERILGWMDACRKGEQEKDPCFWSLYALSTINSSIIKNVSPNCENYHVEGLQESVDYLIERMGDSPHVKYYGVRMRKQKGDVGSSNNFPNPHYKNYSSSINGFGAAPGDAGSGLTWNMIGMLHTNMQQQILAREELTQVKLDNIAKENELKMEQFMKSFKDSQKIKELKEENEALKNAKPQSVLLELFQECKTELFDFAKFHINGQIPYRDDKIGEHDNDDKTENKNETLLSESIELLKKNVERPEELIFKMSFVLDNLPEDQAKTLLNMLQANYEALKKQKNGNT